MVTTKNETNLTLNVEALNKDIQLFPQVHSITARYDTYT